MKTKEGRNTTDIKWLIKQIINIRDFIQKVSKMACRSSLTKEDLRQIKSYEKDDILTQSAKNVRSLHERSMSPEDVELTDNENSSDEKYSCDEDNNIDTDEYDEDEDTRFLDVCMDGDIEDLVQLLEEMAQAGETLSTEMLNCADSTDRVSVFFSNYKNT